jgi:membrane fusion protein (multidrug efflux system)
MRGRPKARAAARAAGRRWPHAASLAALAVLVSACGDKPGAAGPGAGAGAPPPPEVGVITVALRPVGIVTELPGRLEASRVAQVRARVPGIVQKRLFTEGSDVKAGQPLFQIDPASLQASVASAQATLARAQANVTQATAQAERYKPLLEANAISKQDYVNAVAAQKTAEADVARGARRAADRPDQPWLCRGHRADLGPDRPRPGDRRGAGRPGRGDPARPGAADQSHVRQLHPVDDRAAAAAPGHRQRQVQARRRRFGERADRPRGRQRVSAGRALLFTDLSVDPSSGQITLRAEVPNPTGLLLPGMYVRVRIEQAETPTGIVVPQQAVTRGTTGDSVMVVGATARSCRGRSRSAPPQGGQWVILEG